ncbi:MAG: DNA-binding protein [Sterolibacterium sp.]|nr:DNA-binding protein [Sterolibacterium sp.]
MTPLDTAIAQRLSNLTGRRERVFAVAALVHEATGSLPSVTQTRTYIGSGSNTDIHKDLQVYRDQQAQRHARLLDLPELPESFVQSLESLAKGLWEQSATEAKATFDAERQAWAERIQWAEKGRADAETLQSITFTERQEAVAARDQAQTQRDALQISLTDLTDKFNQVSTTLTSVRETAETDRRLLTIEGDAARYAENLMQRQVASLESRVTDLTQRLDDSHVLENVAQQRANHLETELARADGRIEELLRQLAGTPLAKETVKRHPATAQAQALKRRLGKR